MNAEVASAGWPSARMTAQTSRSTVRHAQGAGVRSRAWGVRGVLVAAQAGHASGPGGRHKCDSISAKPRAGVILPSCAFITVHTQELDIDACCTYSVEQYRNTVRYQPERSAKVTRLECAKYLNCVFFLVPDECPGLPRAPSDTPKVPPCGDHTGVCCVNLWRSRRHISTVCRQVQGAKTKPPELALEKHCLVTFERRSG